MDFIERIFGVAPDGGSGSLEAAIIFAICAGAALLGYLKTRRTRRLRPRGIMG